MSKSDDNTNELESYGVWVKKSNGNGDAAETPADTSDELNLDDGGLDLPDFDDSDFSDMFKDEPADSSAGALDDFGSEDDTTLSTDELANITDGFEVEQVDAPAESEELDLGDFDVPEASEDIPSEDASEEVSFDMDEPETQTIKSVIKYKSKTIKVGGSAKTFTAQFIDDDGVELDITPKWQIVCDFVDKLIVTESGNKISIATKDDSCVDEDFRLVLTDSEDNYESSLIVSVVSLL